MQTMFFMKDGKPYIVIESDKVFECTLSDSFYRAGKASNVEVGENLRNYDDFVAGYGIKEEITSETKKAKKE